MVTAPEIQPGETGKIEVTVDTTNRQGKMAKGVTVVSDDPDEPRLRLTLEGQVEALVSFGKRQVDFGRVLPGEVVTKVLPITTTVKGLEPGSVQINNAKAFEAKLISTDGQPAVEVRFVAPKKPGRIVGQLKLDTGLEKQPVAWVTLMAQVNLNIVTEPLSLVFAGPIRPAQQVTLVVRALDKTSFNILNVTDELGVVEWEQSKRAEGGYVLRLKLNDARKAAGQRSSITIETDSKDVPQLEVPYVVRSAQRKVVQPRRGIQRVRPNRQPRGKQEK